MSFNVYQGSTKKTNVSTLYANLTGLSPATTYIFSVSETDGEDESSKSGTVSVTTNGLLTIPTTKEVASIYYATNCLGIETDGLDTSGQFGGTIPVAVAIKKSSVVGSSREIEVAANYHMNGVTAALVETNKYRIIDGNRSMEITVK